MSAYENGYRNTGQRKYLRLIQNYLTLSKKIKINNENNNLDSNIHVLDNKKRENQFMAINKSIKIESLIGISFLVVASFLSITSPPSLVTTTNQVTNESNSNSINISTNANNLGFFVIIIILSVIISIIGFLILEKIKEKLKTSMLKFTKDTYNKNDDGLIKYDIS